MTPFPQAHAGCIIGINIGKNAGTPNEEAVMDYLALQIFNPHADYLRQRQLAQHRGAARVGRQGVEALLTRSMRRASSRNASTALAALVKLAPDLTAAELDSAVGCDREHAYGWHYCHNTTWRGMAFVRCMHQNRAA
jgi:dihydroorotate dehydrogenase